MVDENVAGLNVTVDAFVLVQVVQAADNLPNHCRDKRLGQKRERFAPVHLLGNVEKRAQASAVHVLHDKVHKVMGVVTAKYGHDVLILGLQPKVNLVGELLPLQLVLDA